MKNPVKLLFSAIFAIILLSCAPGGSETDFEYGDISFVCPAGWSVTGTDDYVYSQIVTVEKDGHSSSGIVLFTLLDNSLEILEMKQLMQESIEEQGVFRDLKFFDLPDGNYGRYKCMRYGYTGNIFGLEHESVVCYFEVGNWICFVSSQQTTDDRQINRPGFERLEETFEIITEAPNENSTEI